MTKHTKSLLGLLGAAIVIAIVYFAAMQVPSQTSDMASTTMETATSTDGTTKTAPARTTPRAAAPAATTQAAAPIVVTWRFSEHGNGTNQISTDVTAVANEKEYALGEFLGTCKTIATEDLKGANEVSGVNCLDGEKGTEIGVFRSGSTYVIQKGDIVIGDSQNPGKRGPFVTIKTI